MNNGDLTTQSLRDLQAFTLRTSSSPDKIVEKINFVIARSEAASKEINQVNNSINRIINVLEERKMFNGDILAAFTGLDNQSNKVLEMKIKKAKEELSKE